MFPHDDAEPDALMRHADLAMYRAKQSGKNRYHLFDAEDDRQVRHVNSRIERLHQALHRGEFTLYYQPKVDMRRGCVVGAEALLRWNHPERGMLLPADFLPLIEDDVLILEVGDWVIREVLAQMAAWQAAGLKLRVSVNVAGRQLQEADFVHKLWEALNGYPNVVGQLELEILETTGLEDVVKVSRIIDQCRELGVQFALDDFGTGYSSLTYLKRLPADTIKIDQSFVRELLNDANNLVIVQSVIQLAQSFQRSVIAEGVETEEHGRMLLQLGCDLAQGHGIARPMPAAQLVDWVGCWTVPAVWQDIRHLRWDDSIYAVLIAEVEHRNWVDQVVYAVQEGVAPSLTRLDDVHACRLGQWHDQARASGASFVGSAAFAGLAVPHRHVHEVVGRMDRSWRDGHTEQARALVPELLQGRDAMLKALMSFEQSLAQSVPN
jgi:EAL domain-containing protein (putative c-di-GMP-specific phosphodiesterase class I)